VIASSMRSRGVYHGFACENLAMGDCNRVEGTQFLVDATQRDALW